MQWGKALWIDHSVVTSLLLNICILRAKGIFDGEPPLSEHLHVSRQNMFSVYTNPGFYAYPSKRRETVAFEWACSCIIKNLLCITNQTDNNATLFYFCKYSTVHGMHGKYETPQTVSLRVSVCKSSSQNPARHSSLFHFSHVSLLIHYKRVHQKDGKANQSEFS